MPDCWGDAKRCTHESPCHFRDELFAAVGCRTEFTGLVAVQPRAVADPMGQLMKGCAMPVNGFVKGLRPWHCNKVMGRTVIGLRTADPEISTGRIDQRLRSWQNETISNGLRYGLNMVGQPSH